MFAKCLPANWRRYPAGVTVFIILAIISKQVYESGEMKQFISAKMGALDAREGNEADSGFKAWRSRGHNSGD